jgi:hypothetical protein
MRCRDRDDAVRREAMRLLAQFPQASLERLLAESEWRAMLDTGLAGPVPGSCGGKRGIGAASAGACKHAAAIRSTAVQLLRRHLAASGMGGDRGEREAAAGNGSGTEEEEMGKGGEQPPATSCTWMHRLQALQPPPSAAAPSNAASLLRCSTCGAAWASALQQVLSPEQLQAWREHASALG